jgi:hypothetical protein
MSSKTAVYNSRNNVAHALKPQGNQALACLPVLLLLHHSPSWLLVLLLLLLHQYSLLLLLLLLLELLGMPPPHGGIHICCRPVFFRPHEQTRLTVYTSNKAHIQARQRGFQSHNVVLTHQDTTLCGLGCPSLLVEYSTIQVQRLVRALRDTTTHMVLSPVLYYRHNSKLRPRLLKLQQQNK